MKGNESLTEEEKGANQGGNTSIYGDSSGKSFFAKLNKDCNSFLSVYNLDQKENQE